MRSRSPSLRLSCAFTLLPYSMIYPPEKQWKFPSEPLQVTPSVCACLSATASSFLKLGPPVGLQTLLNAHSYASLLPNTTSTGMRKKPEVSLDHTFWYLEISEKTSQCSLRGSLGIGFWSSENLNKMERKGRRMNESHCLCELGGISFTWNQWCKLELVARWCAWRGILWDLCLFCFPSEFFLCQAKSQGCVTGTTLWP